MKKIFFLLIGVLINIAVSAQIVEPVKFSTQLKMGNGAEAEIVFTAKIDKGWHVYSTELNGAGPTEASFHAEKMDGVELVGKLQPVGKMISAYDEMFEATLKYFENSCKFVQKIRFTKENYSINCYLEYAACNDSGCLPPTEVSFSTKGKAPKAEPAEEKNAEEPAEEEAVATDTTQVDSAQVAAEIGTDLWTPVVEELKQSGETDDIASHGLLYIFFMGLVGGLLALVMPCIWPIIPMTVSFFLKRAKDDKQKGIRDAMTYGVSIVVIYLTLGILVTAIAGPSKLNELSTNAYFNIFLFALLVVFACSFFGWFEIKLPDSWANKVDTKASSTTGLLSIFLMAFTLVLVSFSCTAPIIGLLLVETVTSGNWVSPTVGMLGFAMALAVPFTLFALFPSWLKSAPRSGSWMTTIKVVLGFVELAFSLKFFSVADLAYGWHLLDREVFLSLWIAIFIGLGLYLIGVLKFQEDEVGGDINKPMPVVCIMGGLVSLAFAIYMIPGLWGAPCKAVSAFAPPVNTQDFNLNTKTVEAKYTDYELGMAAAKAEGKPAFIDFTGFGCVNCRKMEAAVWTDPSVADKLEKDYVLISLYVDDKTPLPQPMEVEMNGQKRTLRTVGDKWSYLQAVKFGSNAQPYYVPLDNEGKPLCGVFTFKEDVAAFMEFLNKGLSTYKK